MSVPTWTLFEEPWWLDCVAPSQWSEVTVSEGGRVSARMPYVLRTDRLRRISLPPLTPWLGPCVVHTGARPSRHTGNEHEALAALIGQLPQANWSFVAAAPEQTNLLPFYWAGYNLGVAYTYRLDMAVGRDGLWEGLRDNIRREIRKAEKQLTLRFDPDPALLHQAMAMTFARQGMKEPTPRSVLDRVCKELDDSQRTVISAFDGQGRLNACMLYVHDSRHTFYLGGGADPELRNSGAQSLIMWRAICDAIGRSTVFDFEGSMVAGIERFVRGFGAVQTIRLSARKNDWKGALADSALMVRSRLQARQID